MKISHSAISKAAAAGTFLAGALLALIHSMGGAIGIAVLVAVVAGAVAGLLISRPHLGYGAGAALAALAAFAGGFVVVGLFAAAYAIVVAESVRRRQVRRVLAAA